MNLKMKRIYDAPSSDDGKRIFVDRLWARGLTKEKAQIDSWEKELAPSNDLRKWYGHDIEKFEEFKKRYRSELDEKSTALEFARNLDGNVTLLFGAKNSGHFSAGKVCPDWNEAVEYGATFADFGNVI